MNKAELIEYIATECKITKAQTERMLDTTLEAIKKNVKKGDEVKLVGFGTFTKAKRKARMGRNPQTGKALCRTQNSVQVRNSKTSFASRRSIKLDP